ncbi:MAG: TIGR01212 family radical SAM protein [Bacteroidales bacterium]|nr:TIGR01212 family radical SAM protein [Bacteroidales bacterium]
MTSYSWGTERRINAASVYMKRRFGTRIQKVSLDAGFSCPNRDGTKSTGGCSFCNNDAFNPSYCHPGKSIAQQLAEGIAFHERRYRRAAKYVAYFQAFSNTHAPLEVLKERYQEALKHDGITGLIIGTRPDCIDEAKLGYLAELNQTSRIVIEYGIESIYNKTLQSINRGHSWEDSVRAIEMTHRFGIECGAHIIFGLPGESREEMMQSVTEISRLPLHSIKFHQLQVVKGTRFGKEFLEDPDKFELFTLGEYIEFITEYLSRLNPDFIIERLAAETQPGNCISERWGLRYDQVLQKIERRMEERDLWQGKFFKLILNSK